MKIKLFLLSLLACVACQQPKTDSMASKEEHSSTDTLSKAALTTDSTAKPMATATLLQPYTFVETNTLIPGSYRIWEGEIDPEKIVNKHWFDLHKTKDSFALTPLDYRITRGHDECADVETKTLLSANESLLFINHPHLKLAPESIIIPTQNKLWPQQSLTVEYNGIKYTLSAAGDKSNGERQYVDNGKTGLFYMVKNYSLNLKIDGQAAVTLFDVDQFDHTFMQIEFIGDLDADGKLDFIFSVPRNYEEERLLCFLSSTPNKAFEAQRSFDC